MKTLICDEDGMHVVSDGEALRESIRHRVLCVWRDSQLTPGVGVRSVYGAYREGDISELVNNIVSEVRKVEGVQSVDVESFRLDDDQSLEIRLVTDTDFGKLDFSLIPPIRGLRESQGG